ncbi:MAG: nucleotidyltransferase domain-containing protein [Phycisphaerales bacterium]
MTQIIEQNKNELAEICRRFCVSRLDVFGSAACGDFDEQTSDIDLLVEFDSSVNQNRFDNFFALQEELQKLFNRSVDLVEPGGLENPYFIESINQTRKKIYASS